MSRSFNIAIVKKVGMYGNVSGIVDCKSPPRHCNRNPLAATKSLPIRFKRFAPLAGATEPGSRPGLTCRRRSFMSAQLHALFYGHALFGLRTRIFHSLRCALLKRVAVRSDVLLLGMYIIILRYVQHPSAIGFLRTDFRENSTRKTRK